MLPTGSNWLRPSRAIVAWARGGAVAVTVSAGLVGGGTRVDDDGTAVEPELERERVSVRVRRQERGLGGPQSNASQSPGARTTA